MTFHDFIFGGYPYLAGTIFLLGSWIRFDREQYTWKSDSSQLLSNKNMRLASNLFHVGILAVFFGHLVGLLTPQYVALYLGTIFGSICLIGALLLFLRRLNDPRIRAVSRTRDTFIIGWLLATVAIGLGTTVVSWGHAASGDTSTMIQLTLWVQSVATLQPQPDLLQGVELIFKIHLFFGMTVLLLFPFTRMVHVWSVPLSYLGRAYQIVRVKRVTMN